MHRVNTTLEEDLARVGVSSADFGVLEESEDGSKEKNELTGSSIEKPGENPLDADKVNFEMFEAVMGLPFDKMETEEIEQILEELKKKNVDDPMLENEPDDLRERAEEVVDFLLEKVAVRTRRAKSGRMAKKASFQCPEGYVKDSKDKTGKKCIRAAKAAGGSGKLKRMRLKKKKWSRSGAGKVSSRKSKRWASRREDISPFASELMGVVESADKEQSIRGELVEQVEGILDLCSEEFNDEAVTRIFEDAYEPVSNGLDSGRLDEDMMSEDEFMSEIRPVITLILKSYPKINGETDSGN